MRAAALALAVASSSPSAPCSYAFTTTLRTTRPPFPPPPLRPLASHASRVRRTVAPSPTSLTMVTQGGGRQAGGRSKGQPKGGAPNEKKRRFLQDLDFDGAAGGGGGGGAAAASTGGGPSAAGGSGRARSAGGDSAGGGGGGPSPSADHRSSEGGRSASAAAAAAPNPRQRASGGSRSRSGDPSRSMMQSSKSIEELESIMSDRWGTKMDKWSADPDEFDFVYGGGDKDDGDDDGGGVREDKTGNAGGRSPIFRAKPVLDPWQKEKKARQTERDGAENDKREKKKSNVAKVLKDSDRRQDVVLDRVRRNQERMRAKREAKVESSGGGRAAGGGEEVTRAGKEGKRRGKKREGVVNESDLILDEDEIPEMKIEFYDEDDEGYEAPGSTWSEDDDDDDDDDELNVAYDAIISPEPAGGSGRRRERPPSKADDSTSGGGFFFKQSDTAESDAGAVASSGAEEKSKRKKKERESRRRPAVLDDDGKEMLLTLEQAERNVDAYLASISADGVDEGEEGTPPSVSSWEDVGITDDGLLENLRHKMRCPAPLSVQDQSCPPVLSGNDVLVSTHTGSGKTLAFLAPLAQRMLFDSSSGTSGGGGASRDTGVKVIIVAPGRELASQIVSVARDLFEGTGLTATLAIGGTPFTRNVDMIRKRKPDVVIGTPGRIAELVVGRPGEKAGRLKIPSLQTIVLDEFDALLEYEAHREPTGAIVRAVKRRHGDSLQSILCSATAADMMGGEKLGEFLRPAYAHAKVDEGDKLVTSGDSGVGESEESTLTKVSRTAIHGTINVPHKKLALDTLRRILHTEPIPHQILVFVDNARRVGIIVDKLAAMGIVAAPLHGGQGSEKGDRAEVSKALREGYVGIVVATELAARGIDAPYLTHVVNLDLPTDASHYAHRAGRCGRGGRPGVVINITSGTREKGVPMRFADSLGIEMNMVEARTGKLIVVEDDAPGGNGDANDE